MHDVANSTRVSLTRVSAFQGGPLVPPPRMPPNSALVIFLVASVAPALASYSINSLSLVTINNEENFQSCRVIPVYSPCCLSSFSHAS